MNEKEWRWGWISGRCLSGHHEGTKILSPSGVLFQDCNLEGCNCQVETCHKFFAVMRQFITENTGDTEGNQSTSTDHAPATQGRTVTPPDPPGEEVQAGDGQRKNPGWLERQVKKVCDHYVDGWFDEQLTPKLCAELIAQANPGYRPSTGAIDAVWRRWVRVGFATMGSRPVRFTGYTTEGTEKGLAKMTREREFRRKHDRRTWEVR